jgi:hypothetical protein
MGNVKPKHTTRFQGARLASFVLVALLLALPASSIASERDRLSGTPLWSTKKSRAATAGADDSAAINKLIADINAAAKANKARMLRIIIINTDVAGSTLEQEKSRTGLSLGEVYVAHSLAMASHKSFNQIVALKAKGQSWAKIAQMHNISLRGSTAALKEMLKE